MQLQCIGFALCWRGPRCSITDRGGLVVCVIAQFDGGDVGSGRLDFMDEKQSLDETINALAIASPFTLEEKQILLEAENLDLRKTKISEILKTYTFDIYENNTIQ